MEQSAKKKPRVDVHAHHMAIDRVRGGYLHPRFGKGVRIRTYMYTLGLVRSRVALMGTLPSFEELHDLYEEHFLAQITAAASVTHVVVMPFDGVYDHNGYIHYGRTPKMTTNDAVYRFAKRSQKVVPSTSINPMRRDWEDELAKAIETGAVHNKWLPSVMGFDPGERRHAKYYQRVRDARLVHLIHIGMEYALPNIDVSFGDLKRLEHVLREGVTVIAAHVCGGKPFREDWSEVRELYRLVEKYPNLYFDISGMTSGHRKPRLKTALSDPVLQGRIVYGTDFPVPIQRLFFRKEARVSGDALPKNYFDRYHHIVSAMGCTDEMLERGGEILGIR